MVSVVSSSPPIPQPTSSSGPPCSSRQGRALVRQWLRQGIAEGDLPADADAMATFYTATLSSLSLEARDGATEADLTAIIDGALAAWPSDIQPNQADGAKHRESRPHDR